MAGATILHADLDAFYASVEQLLDPTLRGKPIAVGGGVVLAASYEARRFGVSGGMSGRQAKRLCPALEFVHGHFREYSRLGDQVMAVLQDFTPIVERVSIDEAFLDVSGALRLFGRPPSIAEAIRHRVRHEIGLPISVGVARTKHLAKVASQVAKPDGMVVVEPDNERAFLRDLPVGLVWGVGPVTRERLAAVGITTIGELASTSKSTLAGLLGRAAGEKLSSLAGNIDGRRVTGGGRAASVGAQSALGRRPATTDELRYAFGYLADRVASRMRAARVAGRTVTARVRFADLRAVTRSITLPVAIAATATLRELAVELGASALADHPREREISLVAISVSHLVAQAALQLELGLPFGDAAVRPGSLVGAARWSADLAVDAVRDRFGKEAIGYAAVHLDRDRRIPDEFRELAERRIR